MDTLVDINMVGCLTNLASLWKEGTPLMSLGHLASEEKPF